MPERHEDARVPWDLPGTASGEVILDGTGAERTGEEHIVNEPAGSGDRPTSVQRLRQSRNHKLHDAERQEDDGEADRAVREHLLPFADLLLVPTGRHPEEPAVQDDDERDEPEDADERPDDLRDRHPNVLRREAGGGAEPQSGFEREGTRNRK